MDAVDDLLYSRASYELRCARLFWCIEAARLLLRDSWIKTFDIEQDPIHAIRVDAPWCTVYGGLHDAVDTAVRQVPGRLNAALLTAINRLPRDGTLPVPRAGRIDRESRVMAPAAFSDAASGVAAANGAAAWRILPKVEGASIAAQASEKPGQWNGRLNIAFLHGRSATSWVPVALGPWSCFAGCNVKLPLVVRSDEESVRVAYLRLQRARSDRSHLLQNIGVRGAPAGQPCELVFALPANVEGLEGGLSPDEILELWLPLGPTACEVTFDFGPLEITPTEEFAGLVAALGNPVSGHVNNQARTLAETYEMAWSTMEDVLGRIPVSVADGNGAAVTLCDVAANSPAWQDYQIARLHRLVGGKDAGAAADTEERPEAVSPRAPITGEEIGDIYETVLLKVKEAMGIADRRQSVGVDAVPARATEAMGIR